MNDKHEHVGGERDDVATLVRLAGRRQSVPPERAERVKTAARDHWRHQVRRRSRRRYVAAAAGVAAAALLAVAIRTLGPGAGGLPGTGAPVLVEAMSGPAWFRVIDRGEATEPRILRIGEDVGVGSELVTDAGGRVAIRLATGHSVRLDASTTLRVVDDDSVALVRGAIYVDSGFGRTRARSLDVHTPLGVIREIGTQFEVRVADRSVQVRLREGAVVVHHEDQADIVQAGTELELGEDGSVTRREISAHAPAWGWITDITPMLDLEGRTAREFLEWAARERGWSLAFADDNAERAAGMSVLSGTTSNLTLDEALHAVLMASRLTHHIDDGTLIVETTP